MYGGKPGASKSGSSRKGSIGLHAKPGDRGDASLSSGMSGLKGGKSPAMPSQLKSECSEGYESVNSGWHGNVKR